MRRALFLADKHFRPRPGKSARKPFPDWVTYAPNSMWIYDTTHFPAAGMAVLIIEDLISRKWITEIASVEETSTQVELAFTAALDAEGLLEVRRTNVIGMPARRGAGRVVAPGTDLAVLLYGVARQLAGSFQPMAPGSPAPRRTGHPASRKA